MNNNCSFNPSTITLTGVLNKFLQDIKANPDEALPQSFAFLAFIESQPIPKVPRPPPDLEPFNINISEQIQEVSNQYRKLIENKKIQQKRTKVIEKSSTDIIEALPKILNSRSEKEPSISNDDVIGSIAERVLYPSYFGQNRTQSIPQSSIVNINQ